MPKLFCISLSMLLLSAAGVLSAQTTAAARPKVDLAVTFVSERTLKANTTSSFWMEGGSFAAGVAFAHGIGIVADVTGAHTASIGSSGVPLTLLTVTFGPRYRWSKGKRFSLYGEALAGFARGSNSLFPAGYGTVSTATSPAVQLSGGLDYRLSGHISVRALDVGYLRTTLPNDTDNVQNLLRLGAGVAYRF